MPRTTRKYSTSYKKKVDVERDVYLPRKTPKGVLLCNACGAVCYRKRWTLDPPETVRDRVKDRRGGRKSLCPGCQKKRDHYPFGELVLSRLETNDKPEIMRLLRNEEKRAQKKNPLQKIISLSQQDAGLKAETTNEKLAQRLGRCLKKARGGKVTYRWSHNNKFVRVRWEKTSPDEGRT